MAGADRVSPAAADLRVPLDIPLLLSGNFGELRNNHFHSGVDFKTQGRTGLPVYCAADGYVSRVLVSPWGFGRAVYVTHPELGLVTVYGHLQSFATRIDNPVRGRQYADETFSIDVEFGPGVIPVRRGELLGRSGNAGSSGGPHLHIDVRDASPGNALDPL
ncbi:MAG: M23 family metallopeptidase, partial [Muribaculaceae bacterium]|nr:M23 family metallopeptidase [Muribaculaceae bacterium]